jgi:CBS domain-containing protein
MIIFSQFLGKRIVDADGERVGTVRDIVIRAGEKFPEVSGMATEKGIIGWENVDKVAEAILLKKPFELTEKRCLVKDEMLLGEAVLDKQIVDTDGIKVIKVNDIILAHIRDKLCVVLVDTGIRGILRRLGLHKVSSLAGHENLIPWDYVEPLDPELHRIQLKISRKKLEDLHPADIADIITELGYQEREEVLSRLSDETAADVLEEVSPEISRFMIATLESGKAADILEEMSPDKAADVLADASREKAEEILNLMEKEEAEDVKELLGYKEDSAGGIMTTDFLQTRKDFTAQEVMEEIRKRAGEFASIYYIYVTDENERLTGVVSLRDLIVANPSSKLSEFMTEEVVAIPTDTSQEDVANILAKYNLLAVPVIDRNNHIRGIVTVDDAIDMVIPTAWKKKLPKMFPR